MKQSRKQILVAGGGASGLWADIPAARRGAKVTLLEKNKQTGKKLLVTGNGRCNFTNRNQDMKNYRSGCPAFVEQALREFSMEDAVKFFEDLGIPARDRDGYLYPADGQASSVASALRLEAERLKVRIGCNTEILSAEYTGSSFQVKTAGWQYEGDALILTCGSPAAPGTGASGDGYRLAEGFGHTVVPPLPALTGLYAAEKDCAKLAGIRQEAKVVLLIDGKECIEETGEVQFTSYGLSGIPVFQVSRYVSRALEKGRRCEILLNLWEGRGSGQTRRVFEESREYTGERSGTDTLLGVFPEKLSGVLLERAGISRKKKRNQWTQEEEPLLITQAEEMRFSVVRCRGFEQAQVCTGGVPLTELKGITMESACMPGLYLAGELLDVDGACGGYNLQWAWTSGYLAGSAAAEGTGTLC